MSFYPGGIAFGQYAQYGLYTVTHPATLTDERAIDTFVVSGTANTIVGAITADTDKAVEFVASGSGYANGGDNYGFAGATALAFSVEFWVRLRVAAGSATLDRILTKDGTVTGQRQGWLIYWSAGPVIAAARYVNAVGAFAGGTTAVDNLTWKYVVVTYDQTYLRIYMNSVLESTSGAQTTGTSAHTTNLYLGAYGTGGGFSDMQMDELAIYSRALLQAEITDHYRQGIGLTAGRRFGLLGARRHATRFRSAAFT